MTQGPFRTTIGDGVAVNYDEGFLEVSPSRPSRFGITIPLQRGDTRQDVRLAYSANDATLYLYYGFPAVTISVECTMKEAGTLSESLNLPIADAYG